MTWRAPRLYSAACRSTLANKQLLQKSVYKQHLVQLKPWGSAKMSIVLFLYSFSYRLPVMKTEKLVYFHEGANQLLERSSIQVWATASYSKLAEVQAWGRGCAGEVKIHGNLGNMGCVYRVALFILAHIQPSSLIFLVRGETSISYRLSISKMILKYMQYIFPCKLDFSLIWRYWKIVRETETETLAFPPFFFFLGVNSTTLILSLMFKVLRVTSAQQTTTNSLRNKVNTVETDKLAEASLNTSQILQYIHIYCVSGCSFLLSLP